MLTQKNVVVVYPENVVDVVVENVVDPSENVVVVRKNVDQNVVGGGEIKQWAAVKAARSMTREKSLSFVMAPGQGFEPWTNGLTVHCSTAELFRNVKLNRTILAIFLQENLRPRSARPQIFSNPCLQGQQERFFPLGCLR